jgi:hypothetical protein
VYFVVSAENEYLYIGQTSNLKKRWATHDKVGNLKRVRNVNLYWVEIEQSDPDLLLDVEEYFIARFKPALNKVMKPRAKAAMTTEQQRYYVQLPEGSFLLWVTWKQELNSSGNPRWFKKGGWKKGIGLQFMTGKPEDCEYTHAQLYASLDRRLCEAFRRKTMDDYRVTKPRFELVIKNPKLIFPTKRVFIKA